MHFRIRGNSVQVIKSVPNLETGKAFSKPIGSANLLSGKLNKNAEANLSSEEKEQVIAWLEKRAIYNKKVLEVGFEMLPETLSKFVVALNNNEFSPDEAVIDDVEVALRDIRNALHKLKNAP